MKRHFPGLHAEALRAIEFWKVCSWFEWIELTIAGTRKSPSSFSASRSSNLVMSSHAKCRDESTAPRSRSGN